jgi:glycosyltransferase involved in cell wall biosynthesis
MKREPSPLGDVVALLKWWRLLGKVKPDVVSIGTPKASLLGLLAARVRRIPVRVYVLRGLRLEGTRGFLRTLLYWLESLTSSNSTHIISVSPSLRDLYVSLKLSDIAKVSVIGMGSSHGVDTNAFRPEQSKELGPSLSHLTEAVRGGRPVLGFVGRFSEDKGALTLLACKRHLAESGIEHELVIVGPIEGASEVLSAMNSVGRPVTHVGHVQDLTPFYSVFDLLLLPTKREGFPNVVLEAAAAGVPVVTTSATGAVDSVISGVTGIVVPVGADPAFCEEVERLILNPALRMKMGKRARARVCKNFDQHQVTRRHMKFYRALLPVL